MSYLTAAEILKGLKYCALLLVVIAVLLIVIAALLTIIIYQNKKRYIELRYIADRVDALEKRAQNK